MDKRIINLGYCNGWRVKDREEYKELYANVIEGTCKTKQLYRCEAETTFEADLNGEIVIVTFKTDSM